MPRAAALRVPLVTVKGGRSSRSLVFTAREPSAAANEKERPRGTSARESKESPVRELKHSLVYLHFSLACGADSCILQPANSLHRRARARIV
jgi:hypothetical protein